MPKATPGSEPIQALLKEGRRFPPSKAFTKAARVKNARIYQEARRLFDGYRRFVAEAPDELTAWVVLRKAPPLPFLPEEWHGKEVMVLALCYAGDMAAGEKAVAPLRALGEPIADVVSPHPFVGWQAAFDPLLTPGARNYWKSHDFAHISDAAVEAIVEYAGKLPTPASIMSSSTQRIGFFVCRANQSISTGVHAFRCSSGKLSCSVLMTPRYHSYFAWWCNPPTMWSSVQPLSTASCPRARTCSSSIKYPLAERRSARNAQNVQR